PAIAPQRAGSKYQFCPYCDGGPPLRSRPRQNWMQPEVYQRPLMFRTIQSVYSSESPGAPKAMSGQLPGPSFFVKSMWTPPVPMSSRGTVAVAGQLATSCGEL